MLPNLSLSEVAEFNHRRLVDQLYLDWRGYYVVMRLSAGRYSLVNPSGRMSYRAALAWRNPDPARYSLAVVLP